MVRYRLLTNTLGVEVGSTKSVAIWILAGAVLSVFDDSVNAAGFVEVDWEGKRVHIFAVDLHNRGESVNAISAKAGAN